MFAVTYRWFRSGLSSKITRVIKFGSRKSLHDSTIPNKSLDWTNVLLFWKVKCPWLILCALSQRQMLSFILLIQSCYYISIKLSINNTYFVLFILFQLFVATGFAYYGIFRQLKNYQNILFINNTHILWVL